MHAIRFIALVVAVVTPMRAWADGLIYQLPVDGTGVTYDMTVVKIDARQSPNNYIGTLSMASVGRQKVDGKDCRWIELTLRMVEPVKGDRGKHFIVTKILVPESELGEGKHPLKNAVKGWRSSRSGRVKELNEGEYLGRAISPFLSQPLKKVKVEKPVEINTRIGKVLAKKLMGQSQYELTENTRIDKFTADYELQLADEAPFGVVFAKITTKEYVGGTRLDDIVTFTLTLKSIDKNVKSRLPDND